MGSIDSLGAVWKTNILSLLGTEPRILGSLLTSLVTLLYRYLIFIQILVILPNLRN